MVLRRRLDVDRRLDDVERRLEDTEDTVAAALGRDRVDDLAMRLDELAVGAVAHDDLLGVRTDVARLAAEVSRVRSEIHAELDRITSVLGDLGEPPQRRRAAG